MKKFYTDIEALCGLTVVGTTSLSTATGVTVATSDNSTKLATTAFVKSVVSGYVPTTRTITINGTTYDLSANRSWTISTADGYVSNVVLNGSLLEFTGVGSAFSGSVDLSSITPIVRTVYETVKNTSGATILKGTPLAVVAGQTSGNVSDVVPADASDPTKMPAVFIANQNIADQAEGEAILFGYLQGVNTSAYTSGTTVYVAAGGGWTATKPVWPNKIQNLGVITKQHATNGAGIVTGVGRANDLPNLTAGKIWVGTANYPIESTTVHIDEANTRMGVGTSSIEGGLHINYSAANTLLMQRISPDSGPPEAIGRKARGTVSAKTGVLSGDRLWFFAAAGYYGTEGIDGAWSANKVGMNFVASETWTPSAQGTHITWATTAAGQTTRTDKMILTGTGDLGIGTATPASKLHAVGSSTTELRLQNSDANNNYGFVKYETQNVSGGNLVIGTNASGGGYGAMLFIADNNIDFLGSGDLRIVKSGNVGIGTYSPTAKLHTVGTGIVNVVQSLNTVSYTQYYNTSTGTNTTNDGLTVGINGLDAYVYQREAANLIFGTSDAERMRITDTGNVGIGTTSPTQKLDVTDGDFVVRDAANVNKVTLTRFGGVELRGNGTGYRTVGTPNTDALSLATNNTSRIYITSAGNVGIGTTSPSQKLEVAGALVVGMTVPAPFWNAQFKDFSDGSGIYISSVNGGGGKYIAGNAYYYNSTLWRSDKTVASAINLDNGTVVFYTNSGLTPNVDYSPTERMRISSSGNLSIGNTNNTFLLDVGASSLYPFRALSSSGAGFQVNGSYIYADAYNHVFRSLSGTTTYATIDNNGNVGIGTTAPSAQLHVGNGTSQQQWIVNQSIAGWYSGIKLARGAGNNSSIGNNNYGLVTTDNGLEFVNFSNISDASGTRYGVIAQGGNWGINTTGPGEKLHVVGRVRIDGGSTAAILETNDATASDAGTTYKTFTTADHYAVTVDYVIYDAGRTNMRTGTFRAVWSTGDVVYTDVSTVDLGATDNVTLTAVITGANVNLIVTGPTDYTLKYNLKVIK